jgi:hypothetical protein
MESRKNINLINMRGAELKNCIVTNAKQFSIVIAELIGKDVSVVCDPIKGISIQSKTKNILLNDVYEKLAKYYGVSSVESIHIDDTDSINVWIVFN